jgi:hypothetical protein
MLTGQRAASGRRNFPGRALPASAVISILLSALIATAEEPLVVLYPRAVKAQEGAAREVANEDQAMLNAKQKIAAAARAKDQPGLTAAVKEFQDASNRRQNALASGADAGRDKAKLEREAAKQGVPLPKASATTGAPAGGLKADDLRPNLEPAGIYGGGGPNPLGVHKPNKNQQRPAGDAGESGRGAAGGTSGESGPTHVIKPLGLNDRFLDDLIRRDGVASNGVVAPELEDAAEAFDRVYEGARTAVKNTSTEALRAKLEAYNAELILHANRMSQARFDDLVRKQRVLIEELKQRGVNIDLREVPVNVEKSR